MSFDEKGWQKFANLGKNEFQSYEFKEELLGLCLGHEDIAWVVYHHYQNNSIKWMKSKVPALGNKSPRSTLKMGTTTLKQVLWSFPY